MLKERFSFGKNWKNFLETLNEDRIKEAEHSLQSMLHLDTLRGKSFLDIGSGSGLFSLAAARLGADKIHSFDYDDQSVACTRELKQRFFSEFTAWSIEQGSTLDQKYLQDIGMYDVVYSWGVLHHTGEMWQALENVSHCVAENGYLFIAIYNDQGVISDIWTQVKKIYNKLPGFLRLFYVFSIWTPFEILPSIKQVATGHLPWNHWVTYKKNRGMSRWHNIVDWIGGYPFEVATPEKIFHFYHERLFVLVKMKTRQGLGCNEFVFRKINKDIKA
ncbi:MAG: 2-polyprenyl-6-hydroxyphenyl methylase [Candidatus Electronema aureum]|uniref:2-polyprenyl-6-hydroxyphenyl methylase n=1 Tax=Candidatus Electronema aureum TaxID=2005002 RepID=A0A521G079_9BACT|nr:MAG: 2-polyprenyl-6-hydroxyphenyl methylase [Candidatus Electronema aureum]